MPSWRIGIDNGKSLIAEELITVLLERGFPYKELTLYGSNDELGEAVEVEDHEFPITLRGNGLDNPPDILFVTSEAPDNEEAIPAKLTISAKEMLNNHVALVVPELNSGEIEHGLHHGLIAIPTPAAIAVAIAINPLAEVYPIKRLQVTTIEPMSNWGRAGMDLFIEQIHRLLNGAASEEETASLSNLAFNFMPFVGAMLPDSPVGSVAVSELLLERQLAALFPPIAVSSFRCNAPIFYGLGAILSIEFETEFALDKATALLKESPGVMLIDESLREPVALREVVGSDATMVGRLRQDQKDKKHLTMWVALDNLRKGAATSMVEIAEMVIRDHADYFAM